MDFDERLAEVLRRLETLALLPRFAPSLFNVDGENALMAFFAVRLFTYTQGT